VRGKGTEMNSHYTRNDAQGLPTFHVTPAPYPVGSHTIGRTGVRGFVITHEDEAVNTERVQVVRSQAEAAGLNAGLVLIAQQRYVSYQVAARLRDDSRPFVLVGGLTAQTAKARAEHLAEAISVTAEAA
jgi:hypothetical protein